jgi:hypothetical protein
LWGIEKLISFDAIIICTFSLGMERLNGNSDATRNFYKSINKSSPTSPSTRNGSFKSSRQSGNSGHKTDGGMTSSSSYETDANTQTDNGAGGRPKTPPVMLADEPVMKKWRNFAVRSLWTFLMIGGFLTILMSGHIYVVLLVVVLQTLVYREVISIAHVPSKVRLILSLSLPYIYHIDFNEERSTNFNSIMINRPKGCHGLEPCHGTFCSAQTTSCMGRLSFSILRNLFSWTHS